MKKFIMYIIYILIPICVGVVSGLITSNSMADYKLLIKPPLSPPGSVFPIVWTILYILMGTSAFIIYNAKSDTIYTSIGLVLYYAQLFMNFVWSLIFFNSKQYMGAFIWLLIMWLIILVMLVSFKKISTWAFIMCVPLFVWVTFAAYLNAGIVYLN